MTDKKSYTYKESGVDIKAGEDLVNSIKSMVRETHNEQVLSNIGGFGALFAPDLSEYDQPVFVSSVDGVGTKLIVAFKAGVYDTVGQDLVNHCVNDIAVCGARPAYFLDYFSTGKLNQQVGFDVIKGFATACKENGVALIGGETAEMPDIYSEGEFDLAGTIVGIVERSKLITGETIQKGDKLIGIPSSGLHTNGYSLARKVLFDHFDVEDYAESLGTTIGDALLAVHKSYLPVITALKENPGIHGFSHITGGGIIGNTKRILPEGLRISMDWDSWERPAIFKLIQDTGDVPEEDMRATFNLGIGLIAVADKSRVDEISELIRSLGEEPVTIGEIR
ncbi:MAG: phosphoribosylformylglycinamidine cyclo-ligase [Balneolaceae bacterium]